MRKRMVITLDYLAEWGIVDVDGLVLVEDQLNLYFMEKVFRAMVEYDISAKEVLIEEAEYDPQF